MAPIQAQGSGDAITSALEGRQIVFLASIDWSAPWQRHHAFARAFAERGHEVYFVENTGFRGLRWSDAGRVARRLRNLSSNHSGARNAAEGIPRNVRVVSPAVLPPTGTLARRLNQGALVPRLVRKLRRSGLRSHPVVFAYLPTATTLDLLEALDPCLVVYDCAAHFAGHPQPPRDLEAMESALLGRSDRVLADSHFLFEKQSKRHPKVLELHHGVADGFFLSNRNVLPEQYRRFCYFGTLWSAIDYEPVVALARAGFEVDLLGPVKEPPPDLPPSARILAPVPAARLPETLAEYDGLLLPYRTNVFNQGVIPAKTYECLATGKPVLCSPLPELKRLEEYFYLASDPEDWVSTARRLAGSESSAKREKRVEFARRHSAGAQFERLMEFLNRGT